MTTDAAASSAEAPKEPFPRSFYVANGIEIFERLAFYGAYVVLSLYLTTEVGLDDVTAGGVMGLFAFFRLGPLIGGVIADRIGFRISLVVSLAIYALGYGVLFVAANVWMARAAIVLVGIAGGLFKPVITGTVARTSPPGRQTDGFAIFYRMVNAGSVVGKSLTWLVRTTMSLRLSIVNAVVASVVAVGLAAFVFTEPVQRAPDGGQKAKPTVMEVLRGVGTAMRNWRFSGTILILSGFYFMAEQFYQTFPSYITRVLGADVPLEVLTLMNPLTIALFQVQVTKRSAKIAPLTAMVAAMFLGSASMFLMGIVPGIPGAAVSFAVFAFAEMFFAPRFFDYVARFAPKGQEATFMSLTVVPVAIGGMIGGPVSGHLIARYLPTGGPYDPFTIWTIYAGLGLVCAIAMLGFHRLATRGTAAAAQGGGASAA